MKDFSIARLSSARLCAIALSVAVAGCGKAPASSTQVAARVNQDEISVHQINDVLQRQQNLKPEQAEAASKQILERLIDQEIAVQKAEELKLDREPGVMQAIQAARNEVMARAYVERLASGAPKPSPVDVQNYYDSRPALFKDRKVYSLQEIQVSGGPEQMASLRTKVQGATSIKEVADFINVGGLKARASQSTAAPEDMPPALVDQFATMKQGQAIFMPAQGGARIVVVAATQAAPLSFEQARPAVEQVLTNEKKRASVETEMKALRNSSKVEYVGKFAPAASSASIGGAPPAPLATTPVMPAASGVEGLDAGTVRNGLSGLK